MADQFASWNDYRYFSREIKRNRFVHSQRVSRFLNAVRQMAKERVHDVTPTDPLWRAQKGYLQTKSLPFSSKRMKPRSDRSVEGRVNPKGIACLYVANNSKTAIAEIRPGKGAIVSVAVLKAVRNLRVVDCLSYHDRSGVASLIGVYQIIGNKFSAPKKEDIRDDVWTHIDRAFSEPTDKMDDQADYIPTQVIAEVLKNERYDGIAYKSQFGEGINIALFDLNAATVTERMLYEVTDIKIEASRFNAAVEPRPRRTRNDR